MSNQYQTLDSLIALGFVHCKNAAGFDAVGYQFRYLHLTAFGSIDRYFRPVVNLGGLLNNRITIGTIDYDIPPNIACPVEVAAWVSYYLKQERSELGPLPGWFLEGECHWNLVAPARYEQELRESMEERKQAFENCPKCSLDRVYAKPLRRQLRAALSKIVDKAEMTISFDGRILSFALCETVYEVVASGDGWPCAYRVSVNRETTLPTRYKSSIVWLTVLDGFLSIDWCRLGACEAVE